VLNPNALVREIEARHRALHDFQQRERLVRIDARTRNQTLRIFEQSGGVSASCAAGPMRALSVDGQRSRGVELEFDRGNMFVAHAVLHQAMCLNPAVL